MSRSCCPTDLTDGAARAEARQSARAAEACPTGVKRIEHFKPAVDVSETPNAFIIELDLPGATPDSLAINFEKGALTIGARITDRVPKNARPLLLEYSVGDYQRDFRIGEAVNPAAIDASLKDGVLTVTLPKSDEVRAHRIEVRSS